MEEQLKELVGLLRQSEFRRKEAEKELAVAIALASSASVRNPNFICYLLSAIYSTTKVFSYPDETGKLSVSQFIETLGG